MTTTNVRMDSIADIIRDHVAERFPGARDIQVAPRPMAANGYSNVTEIIDVDWLHDGGHRTQGFVLRTQPPGRELFYDTPLLFQWRMMEAMATRSVVPVPGLVHAATDPSLVGTEFFVMEAVDGRVPVNGEPSYHAQGWVAELTPDERRTLARNAVEQLVAIHDVPWTEGFTFLNRPDRGAPGLDQFLTYQEQWYDWVAKGRSIELIERGLNWLREHQPADPAVCITWGDARVGNMIFGADHQVAAVIDWEQAALGAPEMDVAWWLMFEYLFTEGQGVERLEGIPDRAELIRLYEEISGRVLGDLAYYDVLAWVRITICVLQMFARAVGDDYSGLEQPFLARLAALLPPA